MKKLVTILVLLFGVLGFAHANPIQLTNFQLVWYEGTNEFGGLAKIVDLDEQISPFQVMISNFEDSFSHEGVGQQNFIKPVDGSSFTFDPIELFSISGKRHEIMATSVGIGFTDDGGNLFETNVSFRDNYGASLFVTEVSSVPEPATYLMFLMGLALILGTRKKKSELPYAHTGGIPTLAYGNNKKSLLAGIFL